MWHKAADCLPVKRLHVRRREHREEPCTDHLSMSWPTAVGPPRARPPRCIRDSDDEVEPLRSIWQSVGKIHAEYVTGAPCVEDCRVQIRRLCLRVKLTTTTRRLTHNHALRVDLNES